MVTMDESLERLVIDNIVSPESAYEKAIEKKEFRKTMQKYGHAVGVGDDDD